MFEARLTVQFIRATRNVDPNSLRDVLNKILEDPERACGSHPLRNEWAGFRGADFTKRDRIIYRICDECVRKHQQALHPLVCCVEPDGNKKILTFVDFGDYHISAGRKRLVPARSYLVSPPTTNDIPLDPSGERD